MRSGLQASQQKNPALSSLLKTVFYEQGQITESADYHAFTLSLARDDAERKAA